MVLRVRLNGVGGGARDHDANDGILGLSVNGRAAMMGGVPLRATAACRVYALGITCRPFAVPHHATAHVEFKGFVMTA